MIYCVWYPSGGFGHFINSVLNSYGKGFVRPKSNIVFSNDGNSHDVDYVAPPYQNDQDHYNFDFNDSRNYSLLIDNGINNEGTKFLNFFPTAKILKVCYDDWSWPIVAHTMIVKAMRSRLDSELPLDKSGWGSEDNWAKREKYFLFLRDHALRNAWKPDTVSTAININSLLDYQTMRCEFDNLGIELESFDIVWLDWITANKLYIDPVLKATDMMSGKWHQLNDIWEQAVFYYCIWCKYNIEVPHNDFADFFTGQEQYQTWLESVL